MSMSEKEISKDEAISLIREALVKTGIIIKTKDYIYALYEKEPDRWVSVSIVFGEKNGWKSEVSTKRAILLLMDEVAKSLPQYKEDWKPILSEDELEAVISQA